jgi:hypothetical protein
MPSYTVSPRVEPREQQPTQRIVSVVSGPSEDVTVYFSLPVSFDVEAWYPNFSVENEVATSASLQSPSVIHVDFEVQPYDGDDWDYSSNELVVQRGVVLPSQHGNVRGGV